MSGSAARRIDLVLWDFGGVFTPSPFSLAHTYAEELGTTAPELAEVIFGYSLGDTDHPWHRLERGEIPLKDAFTAVVETVKTHHHPEFDMGRFFSGMSGGEERREAMIGVVAEMRDTGVRNVIVTNNITEFRDGWRGLVDVELFDDVVDSSVEGVRKPDPAIFRIALDRVGIAPDRTAFLDDYPGNVAAAAEIGIHAIHVHPDDPTGAVAELRALV